MVRLTDRPDMIIDVTVDVKQQHNNNKPTTLSHIIYCRKKVENGQVRNGILSNTNRSS